uniref:WW domain-containing protein n=1 Tax=Rhizochromulina marina TaxID=1034831 RepID=A0A7S2RB02_9STRA|mmetsp:Transcript_13551/g.39442  ORF Transcript_13551/g.39442 Transcript_13551/m.39442 type:complete len:443 (+) Transcript_13551:168-1496(+)
MDEAPGTWERFFDDAQQHWYWYNHATGESAWDEEPQQQQQQHPASQDHGLRGSPGERGGHAVPSNFPESSEEWSRKGDALDRPQEVTGSPGLQVGSARREAAQFSWLSPSTAKMLGDPEPGQELRRRLDREEVNEERDPEEDLEEADGMLESSRSRAKYEEVLQQTAPIFWWYRCCFYFHACCCEAPLAVAEAVCRAIVYLFAASFILVVSGMYYLAEASSTTTEDEPLWLLSFRHSQALAREALLLLAGGSSLLIPCCSFFVYRDFRPEADDWQLSPLPTVLGSVDPRRFVAFSLGQGGDASNVTVAREDQSMDQWTGAVLHPPRRILCCEDTQEQRSNYAYDAVDAAEPGDEEDLLPPRVNSGHSTTDSIISSPMHHDMVFPSASVPIEVAGGVDEQLPLPLSSSSTATGPSSACVDEVNVAEEAGDRGGEEDSPMSVIL